MYCKEIRLWYPKKQVQNKVDCASYTLDISRIGHQRNRMIYLLYIRRIFTNLIISGKLRNSNGNDIETKRSNTSIIGVFSVSKRNEPTYSRSWKDGSEVNTIIIIICRIEEITT